MVDVFVFVDESGDLGFSSRSSPFFVLSYVIMLNSNSIYIENKTRRLLKKINTRRKIRGKIQEFKFSNDSDEIRIKFLKRINEFEVKIGAVVVSKDSVKNYLKNDKPTLYNYLAVNEVISTIVSEYLKPHSPYNNIFYTIDRSLSSASIHSFDEYCEEKVKYLSKGRKFVGDIQVKIKHMDSKSHPCLQIADYVAGSVSTKFVIGNSKYYELIKNKIKHKQKWDWKDKIKW